MPVSVRPQLSVDDYVRQVVKGERASLARAITLIESTLPQHQINAQQVLQQLLPYSGKSIRLGISGVPGVGKSTLIDALGTHLTARGHRVAVLAVDPSSSRTGGSILGDKTRMQALSSDANAFIRPSPTSGALGGVTRMTRESIVVCEAAGFDIIIVETVGVGQSEISIAKMVDFYLLLMLPGAGDDLQGIKKGVLEIADMIVVNKADPKDDTRAKSAAAEYRSAMHIMQAATELWQPPVTTCSALHNIGIAQIWETVLDYQRIMQQKSEWQLKRQKQQTDWMRSLIEQGLLSRLQEDETIRQRIKTLESQVLAGEVTAVSASTEIVALCQRRSTRSNDL